MRATVLAALTLAHVAYSQQIDDIWQTTWNQTTLFQYNPASASKMLATAFKAPGTTQSAVITMDDSTVYQTIYGFGGALTDSSALTLSNMKSKSLANYKKLLSAMFNVTDGANSAGLSYLRIPLGSSDFSAKVYSYDPTANDMSLSKFSIDAAPAYVFSVLKDIMAINPALKVHLIPWSPPGWMKDTGKGAGGSLLPKYETVFANYLLKSLQGFKSKGVNAYAIGIQNEPLNSDSTYPTCLVPYDQEARIGKTLRTLMNNNGFTSTKLVGYDHNWKDAAGYPVSLMNSAASVFDGVAFHCYTGGVSDQAKFAAAYPNKEQYFTECTGTIGSDFWGDTKWYMNNLWIGSLRQGSSTGLMWNLALDSKGLPKLPGTSSCGNGCRPLVTVNSDASYNFNQEFYSMAQASKAILPKDSGGPYGQRVKVDVGGPLQAGLLVGAYVTGRTSPSLPQRYSLVVLNQMDNSTSKFNPTPVTTTIVFRGQHATLTFPVGVTTLWWYL
ncbi:glycoside hydrolase family 30 protein [Plicaturopsis crispa FD-325 SS-3]|nr:glycoside hydrolase family 30 protein [Plicaturopsis crispa FD-325 SS-3]